MSPAAGGRAPLTRVAIVGGGIAGALLALRLADRRPGVSVELFAGDHPGHAPDATAASGGQVRGFDLDPAACRLAAAGLTELLADPALRDRAGYREIGSVYLLPPGTDPSSAVGTVDRLLPGSATVRRPGLPFRDLPDGVVGVVERRAGHIAPARLRDAVLADLVGRGVPVRREAVDRVTPTPTVRLTGGTALGYDVVVVAAGAWTPGLLDGGPLRTKCIQYSVFDAAVPGLGAFVDDTTGLYGRPVGDGAVLLGLPTNRWDVDPGAVRADPALADEVAACARRRLGVPAARPVRTVAAADCFHDPPGLALRRDPSTPAVATFTGGSGGAAKTVLAASRVAADALVGGRP